MDNISIQTTKHCADDALKLKHLLVQQKDARKKSANFLYALATAEGQSARNFWHPLASNKGHLRTE